MSEATFSGPDAWGMFTYTNSAEKIAHRESEWRDIAHDESLTLPERCVASAVCAYIDMQESLDADYLSQTTILFDRLCDGDVVDLEIYSEWERGVFMHGVIHTAVSEYGAENLRGLTDYKIYRLPPVGDTLKKTPVI